MKRRNDIGQLHETTAARLRCDGFVRPCVARGKDATRIQGTFSPMELGKQ
jgi:hypothetical protein